MATPTPSHLSESSLQESSGTAGGLPEAVSQALVNALQGLRYGQVTLIVHDGRVMQIDRTDRHRLVPSGAILKSDS